MRTIERYIKEILDVKREICEFSNDKIRNMLYSLGKYLNENPSKLNMLYEYLYMFYGNTIIFSKRSLVFAKIFYQKYHEDIPLIPKNITWNQCVLLLRKNNSLLEDIYIFEVIKLFSLNEKEIDYFIVTGNVQFIPETKSVNNIVLEFMNL